MEVTLPDLCCGAWERTGAWSEYGRVETTMARAIIWASALLFLPLLACTGSEPATGDEDDDGFFSDEDDDGDGAGDGDSGDSDAEDPYEGITCEDELVFQAQSRDPDGYCTTCSGRIELYAVVYNPCDEALSFDTFSNFLVSGGSLESEATGTGEAWASGSDGSPPETWTVPAGDVIEELAIEAPLPAGWWVFSVSFADEGSSSPSTVFEVLESGSGGGSGGGTGGGGPDTGDVEEPPEEG